MRQLSRLFSNRRGILRMAAAITAAVIVLFLFRGIAIDTAALAVGAAVVAFLCAPIASFFERYFGRSLSALCAIGVLLALLAAAVCLLLPVLIRQLSTLAESLPRSIAVLNEGIERLRGRAESVIPFLSFSGRNNAPVAQLAGLTLRLAGSAADLIYRCSLAVVLGFFLLRDRETVLIRAEQLIPLAWRSTGIRMGRAVCRELKTYLRGQGLIAAAVGALAAVGLSLIGVNSALTLGCIVGIFNMIPYFGPVLGGIPAVLSALSTGWQRALLTVIVLWVVQQIDGMVISPRIMSGVSGFSPASVLLAIFVGSGLGGIVGMLIALPLLMTIRTVFRVFVQMHENV